MSKATTGLLEIIASIILNPWPSYWDVETTNLKSSKHFCGVVVYPLRKTFLSKFLSSIILAILSLTDPSPYIWNLTALSFFTTNSATSISKSIRFVGTILEIWPTIFSVWKCFGALCILTKLLIVKIFSTSNWLRISNLCASVNTITPLILFAFSIIYFSLFLNAPVSSKFSWWLTWITPYFWAFLWFVLNIFGKLPGPSQIIILSLESFISFSK